MGVIILCVSLRVHYFPNWYFLAARDLRARHTHTQLVA